MKKIYTLVAVAAAAMLQFGAAAQAPSLKGITPLWGKLLVGNGGSRCTSQGNYLAKGADGNLYVYAVAGTNSASNVISFGDAQIAKGSNYTGNSYNQNMVLTKIDAQGNALWTVSSVTGEGDSRGYIAPTKDGGVILGTVFRHSQGYANEPISFVDANGDTTTINWKFAAADAKRHYRILLMKVTKDGAIAWNKVIRVNNAPVPGASSSNSTNTGIGAYLYGLALDDSENIYISGRQSMELYVPTATAGDSVTIAPNNVEGWTGDSQTQVGNMYLIKLDPSGNYLKHIQSQGVVKYANLWNLAIKGDQIYGQVTLAGQEGQAVTFGDKSVTTDTTLQNLGLVRLDTNLDNVSVFQVYQSTMKGSAFNVPNMLITDDDIYMGAQAKFEFKVSDDSTVSSGTVTRAGMLLKIDRATGNLLGGTAINVNQSSIFNMFEDEAKNLYAAKFTLFGPLALQRYNKQTLKLEEEVNLIASGTATAQNVVTTGNNLYVLSRSNGTAKSKDDVFTLTSDKFACAVSAYQLPFNVPTAVETVNAAKEVKSVVYYNLQGVASRQAFSGVNIKVITYTDGSRATQKLLVK